MIKPDSESLEQDEKKKQLTCRACGAAQSEMEGERNRLAGENERAELPDSDYARAARLAEAGELYRAALLYSRCLDYEDSREKCRELWKALARCNRGAIACRKHAIALKKDGTVLVTDRRAEVKSWRDITSVAAGDGWYAGLKKDGTVLVTDAELQRAVSGWTDITQIAAGLSHIVGLRADGTVAAAGDNALGQCDVSGWEYVTEVAAGDSHTVGLTEWGVIYAAGDNRKRQCAADNTESGWSEVTAIACGRDHTVIVEGGRVYGFGNGSDFAGYRNVAAVFSGSCTMGLLFDGRPFRAGTMDRYEELERYEEVFREWEWCVDDYGCDRESIYAAYAADDWKGILALAAGAAVTLGLTADGTVVGAFAEPCGYPGRSAYFEEPAFSPADIAGWKDVRVVLTREAGAL